MDSGQESELDSGQDWAVGRTVDLRVDRTGQDWTGLDRTGQDWTVGRTVDGTVDRTVDWPVDKTVDRTVDSGQDSGLYYCNHPPNCYCTILL